MNNADTETALLLAAAFGLDGDVSTLIDGQILTIAESATDLWEDNAALAARLAYAAVELAWMEQARAGLYLGSKPSVVGMSTTDTNDHNDATKGA